MGSKALGWALEQSGIPHMEKSVLIALAERSNREGICWPSRRTISDDLGIDPIPHPVTISKALAGLEDRGLLLRFAIKRGQEQIGGLYWLPIPDAVAPTEESLSALLEEIGIKAGRVDIVNPGSLAALQQRGGISAGANTLLASSLIPISLEAKAENLKENLKDETSLKRSLPSGDLAHSNGDLAHPPGPAGIEIVRRISEEISKGKRSWNLPKIAAETWDLIEEQSGAQGCIRLLADYCAIHDVASESIHWGRLGTLYKRWGKFALLGLDVALSKGKEGEGIYNYAEAVCKGKKNSK